MSVVIGLFLLIFGLLGTWLLASRFPHARFVRAGYAFMAFGGLFAAVWGVWHRLEIGVTAAALLAIGGVLGVIGAVRREMRVLPPA